MTTDENVMTDENVITAATLSTDRMQALIANSSEGNADGDVSINEDVGDENHN